MSHLPLTVLASFVLAASALGAGRPILITVDDLPITPTSLHGERADRDRITAGLLAALAKHQITAVGFVTWNNVRDDADVALLEAWIGAGHELGNHTRSHLNLTATSAADAIADADFARDKLATLLASHDQRLRLFRFPYLREGETDGKLTAFRAYLERTGQINLCPTLDTQDWSFERPFVTAVRAGDATAAATTSDAYLRSLKLSIEAQERLSERLFERDDVHQVLLLHANAVGAANWDELFTWLRETGHRFATVDEVLADPALRTPHSYVGDFGPGLWHRIAAERTVASARAEVDGLIADQVAAWNRGDLDGFVAGYGEDALFLSPNGSNRGRAAVLARYRERYPDPAAMGTLAIEVLETRVAQGTEVSMLDDAVPSRVHGVTVAARWHLTYPGQDAKSGLTLIVLQRIGGRWMIVQDASM